MLEAGGLVEIRVGAKGGALVTTPTSEQIGEGLADLLNLSPMTASPRDFRAGQCGPSAPIYPTVPS